MAIPVLDLDSDHIAKELVEAVIKYGFVFIRNRGDVIRPTDLLPAFAMSRSLFATPMQEKEKYKITSNNRGWSSPYTETLDPGQRKADYKEAFNFAEFRDGHAQQPLPPVIVRDEARLGRFASLCHDLCMKLLRLLAQGLEIGERDGGKEWFASRHDPSLGPSGSILRFLYYPSTRSVPDFDREQDVRAGAHTDYGSLTLLFQTKNQPGLEVLIPCYDDDDDDVDRAKRRRQWIPVPTNPPPTERDPDPPILVNVGDLLCFWTDGLFPSVVHRVVVPPSPPAAADEKKEEDDRDPESESESESYRAAHDDDESQKSDHGPDLARYSIAYFCHPADSTHLERVPSRRVHTHRIRGSGDEGDVVAGMVAPTKAITAGKHLTRRLAETYGWKEGS
ncbi:MAG: hypothetical protein M1826_000777 [Phylliscum demangeonii]|nr:MAG: hypothetical protein M1826_000777 [Phylliscum demangeonii]